MTQRTRALCNAVAALAVISCTEIWSEQALAMEPGNFGQTLAGATIGEAIAAPLPPGIYIFSDSSIAQGNGVRQNFGTSQAIPRWDPGIYWSSGFQFLGANWTMSVVQPFYYAAQYPTNGATLGGNGFGPPFGGTVWFETIANPQLTPILGQWSFGNGWFAAAGLTLIPQIGSRYNGTLNPDYFTTEPRAAIAYISPDWHVTANLKYDINGASTGHTGTYQIIANAPPVIFNPALAATIASFGAGYRSGQELFLDVAATRVLGKFEIGPVASFKWQTTSDRPGSGFTCAQVQAVLGPTRSCGKASNASVGGLVGYDFGPADLQVWATDSFSAQDDFKGWGVFTRLSFRVWAPDTAPRR